MMDSIVPTDREEPIPESFPVVVIMQQSPAHDSTWVNFVWEALGITVGDHKLSGSREPMLIYEDDSVRRYLYSGLKVTQYRDECESYYHNLMSPKPSCYVVAHIGDDGETPIPFLVSMSFDEAHAYLEGDAEIFAVPMPPELYRWAEAYVIQNYVAVKRKKRKRQDWKQEGRSTSNI